MIDPKFETFIALVDNGTYTKTASKLGLTQPAITHHIKQLEEEYGIAVFHHNKRKLQLTREGEVLLKYARRAIALDENLRQAIDDVRNSVKSLTLAITPSAQTSIAPQLIAKYCNEHPQVHIKLVTDNINNIYNKLKTYEVDLAIIEGRITSKHFTSILLDTDMLMVAVSVDHPLAKKSSVSLTRLQKENLIMRPIGAGTRSLFESNLRSHNEDIHSFHVNMEIDDVAMIKELVCANMGITIISRSAVAAEIAQGKLVCLPIDEFKMIREINMVYYREFAHPEILRDLQNIYSIYR